MSEPSKPKLSFAQKMMAKYGHEEGQGLGKNGEGITAPIQAVTTFDRRGIGHEDGLVPASHFETIAGPEQSVSRFIKVENLPGNIGAITVRALFESCKGLKDIHLESVYAFAEFETEEQAEDAIEKINGYALRLQSYKTRLTFIDEKDVPAPNEWIYGPNLSTFLREKKENAKIASSTLLCSSFLVESERKYLNAMIGDSQELYLVPDPDAYEGDEEDIKESLKYVYAEVQAPGEILVRMENLEHAREFAEQWNGEYFRSRTVYVKMVADEEMDLIIPEKKDRATKTKGAFFLRPVPKDLATQEAIAQIFPDVDIHNVNFPPNGNSAIVFLNPDDAALILSKYQNGFRFRGNKMWVSPFGKKKQNRNASPVNTDTAHSSDRVVKPGQNWRNKKTFDVIIKGLHYDAKESHIRDFFGGFAVGRVNFPKSRGIVFVGLETAAEQQRAVSSLNRGSILGRPVTVEVTRPKT